MKRPAFHRSCTILLTATLGGCGVRLTPLPANTLGTAERDSIAPFVFVDDADPALASLPSVDNELLVQPFPGADANALAALYAEAGATVTATLGDIDLTVLRVPPGELTQIAGRLADSDLIDEIHRNYIFQSQQIPTDPLFPLQHHLPEIGIAEAWDISTGSPEIAIAIVDTGVQPDHPDLAERIVDGWNIFNSTPDFADAAGHGTKVAGVVAAAANNGVGVTGVTWDSPILAIRVSADDGGATSRHIAAGILWAVGHGAKVINVSFAPLWSNSIVRAAARRAFNRGALVVISAGNAGGATRSRGYAEGLFVGAVDETGEHASFSDRGPFVDIVAPGTSIRTTSMGSTYSAPNGTSFAAPIVAGAAALAWSTNPTLRPATIINALIDTATDLGPASKDDSYGNGLVDVEAAVRAASQTVFLPDNTSPTIEIIKPEPGETLRGRSVVIVDAEDSWGVADVVMSVDGLPFATDTRTPYRFVVAADAIGTGNHQLSWVATDIAGNTSETVTVSVSIQASFRRGAAEITFLSPTAGSLVTGDTTINAVVSSDARLVSVEWLIDNVSVFVAAANGLSSRVTYLWRSTSITPGRHTVTLVVTDASGRSTNGQLELIAP